MKIATGNVISFAPDSSGWIAVFNIGGETEEITSPIVGWATVVGTHLKDGTTTTSLEPAFVWGDMVWVESELREHTPGLSAIQVRPAPNPLSDEWMAAIAPRPIG